MAQGFLGYIGLGKETTWGTPATITDYFEAMSENFAPSFDRFEVANIRHTYGRVRDFTGIKRLEGEISFNSNPHTVGHFLKGALQAHSVTVVETGELWTHDFFTLRRGMEFDPLVPFQPYTFEIFRDVTSAQRYDGCVINTLAFNITPNQDVRVTANMIGRDEAIVAASVPTFPNSPNRPFQFDTASISVGGAASAIFEALTVTFNNNLEGVATLNASKRIRRVAMTDFQYASIQGTLDFTDLDQYNDFVAETARPFDISFTLPNSFQLVMKFPNFVYTAFPMGISGRERLSVDFEGEAFFHPGSNTNFLVSLTTTKSDY